MNDLINQITTALMEIKGNRFVSLTYLSKSSGELARHVINVGFSYHTAVEKSVTELEIQFGEGRFKTPLEIQAATEVMASLKKTLEAHARGEQNEDYTKAGQYIPIGNGVNVNSTDNTIQLFGLSQSKTVLSEGVYPKVNSRPLTIEKRKIQKSLPIGNFREFALDLSQIGSVKVNGQTLELEPVS
jgi:hypothetical protein